MKVYIAGPIKGRENGNREAFAQRAAELRTQGHEPLNPWDIPPHHSSGACVDEPVDHEGDWDGHLYGCFLRADIEKLMYCDAISLLPDWEQSKGATTELTVARAIGLKVLDDAA